MMRLKEFESDNWVTALYKNCASYIQQKPRHAEMYRGMKHKFDKPTIKHARLENRRPVGTSGTLGFKHELHDAANKWFVEHFGKPFRNGVFATGDVSQAQSYGTPYAIYPIGEFEYLWSPYVVDFSSDINWREAIKKYGSVQAAVEQELPKADYIHNYSLEQAIEYGHEIMLWCESYYVIPTDYLLDIYEYSANG